jgi:RNA polymerase sigma-70 factor (ECF subfamily)
MKDERGDSFEPESVPPSIVVPPDDVRPSTSSAARPVLRLTADDHEELKRLWEENRRWVAALLLTHKPRWADLEDLLQEVATTLVGKGHEIRDAAMLKPWLRTVATNVARLAARRGKLRLHGSLDAPGSGGDTDGGPENESEPMPSVTPTRREEAARLLELARKLPDGYREPLLLKSVQGLSYRQIGNILGIPETTVETRIARGRKQLREMAEEAAKS